MIRPLVALAALATLAPLARADDSPKEIVAKAVKAHGGEEFLTKNVAVQSRAKGKMNLPGLGEVDFTGDLAYMLPDKYRSSVEFDVMNQKAKVSGFVNGDKVTVETSFGGNSMDAGEGARKAFKAVPYLMTVAQLAPLLADKRFTLEAFGEAKVEDKPAVGIRVAAMGESDVILFFDKQTHLLVKMEYRGTDPLTGNEVNEERIFTAYEKNRDGIPLPKKMTVKQDGKTFAEIEFVEVTYLEKLPDAEFKK